MISKELHCSQYQLSLSTFALRNLAGVMAADSNNQSFLFEWTGI